MQQKEFEKLIKQTPYHFFVCYTHTPFPISLAIHTYIITVKNGKVTRGDVAHFRNKKKPGKHLFTNYFAPTEGLPIIPFRGKFKFDTHILYHIKGDKHSLAAKVVDFVEKHTSLYPYKDCYVPLPGPNSNSFTQRILDQLPGINVKLPWNAFGKNYFKIRSSSVKKD